MLHSMKLTTKILLLLLTVGIGSVALYGYGGYVTARNALERDSFNKLTAVREMKASQIEDYFRTIRHQIVTFSENRMIVEAMGPVFRSSSAKATAPVRASLAPTRNDNELDDSH